MDFPKSVTIREVGPRDGFQNEPELIPTEVKVDLIERLASTGVSRLEITSFVRPDAIPQLSDAVEVLERVTLPAQVQRSVITPNQRGLERAMAHRNLFDDVNVFVSASETHNRKNVNCSVEDSVLDLESMIPQLISAGVRPRATISTAFGCPYEGVVSFDRVAAMAERLVAAGAVEIGFGDTTGMANPVQAQAFFAEMASLISDAAELTAHFHNTRGQGLANVIGAMMGGCASFDASFGELGGCPVPAGATGNIATEDLVSMLSEMGVASGIDLSAMLEASAAARAALGRPLTSRTLVAGPIVWASGEA